MNQEALVRRRNRTHAIVEGALLGDIAIVFLLMRVYLPVPIVRTLLRAVASVPFVMLSQRRGIRLTILAAVASYILFSALVGPLLALSAIDIAVAGLLAGIGRRLKLHPALNVLWTGVVYAILDLIIPTIVSVIIFRYPIDKLEQGARNFIKLVFNISIALMEALHVSPSAIHQMETWKTGAAAHWQIGWLASLTFLGIVSMYLVVLVSEMVLRQIPDETLERQRAA